MMHTTHKKRDIVPLKDDQVDNENLRTKRHGDKLGDSKQKRTALGNLTNDTLNIILDNTLKGGKGKAQKTFVKGAHTTATSQLPLVHKTVVPKDKSKSKTTKKKPIIIEDGCGLKSSQESVSSSQTTLSQSSTSSSQSSQNTTASSEDSELISLSPDCSQAGAAPAYEDIDKEQAGDIAQVSLYANDIFLYYKQREIHFAITPYMTKQPDLSMSMRSILVDWLVEVQENFELNHETLYLGVKLIDMYLSKKKISKELLQLIGAVALFVACKFDERCPPLVQDFLYICDDAYKRTEFLHMEMSMLKTIGFDLGIPLSYRFLRRYAKCSRSPIDLLTLCRYILELSLMEYSLLPERDSKVAAAALYLGMKMKKNGEWTPTLEHYTGYKREDLLSIAKTLNKIVTVAPHSQFNTIYSKYSHEVFHKVAKVPVITNDELCS